MSLVYIGGGLFSGYNANLNDEGTEKTELRYHVSFSHSVDKFSLTGPLYFKHDYYDYSVELLNGENIINSVEFDYDPFDYGYDVDYWLDTSSMVVNLTQKANDFYFVLRKKPDSVGDIPTFWVDPTNFISSVETEGEGKPEATEPNEPPAHPVMSSSKVSASMSVSEILDQHNKLHDDVARLYLNLQG